MAGHLPDPAGLDLGLAAMCAQWKGAERPSPVADPDVMFLGFPSVTVGAPFEHLTYLPQPEQAAGRHGSSRLRQSDTLFRGLNVLDLVNLAASRQLSGLSLQAAEEVLDRFA